MKFRGLFVAALSVLLLPAVAHAQNNSSSTAAAYVVNEGWINVNMDGGANVQRWYKYAVYAGRSYCVEGVSEKTPINTGTGGYDGETDVFRADGTTLIGRGDDNNQEPGEGAPLTAGVPFNAGRVCYIAPASEFNFMKVGTFGFGAAVKSFQWRVVETTQFCPWFFSGGGFEAFILIKNTTNAIIKATVTLRDPSGTVLGSLTGTAPANGSLNLQVSDPAGLNLPSASGSVEIAYGTDLAFGGSTCPACDAYGRGGPGGLIANVTSLSFTQGVSFDTPAAPRQDFLR
jgi:hypothetical protein